MQPLGFISPIVLQQRHFSNFTSPCCSSCPHKSAILHQQGVTFQNAGVQPKVSPENAAARPLPQVMRATYSQPKADATPARTPAAMPQSAPSPQPYASPANRPSLPPGPPPPSLARSQSFASGQHAVRLL